MESSSTDFDPHLTIAYKNNPKLFQAIYEITNLNDTRDNELVDCFMLEKNGLINKKFRKFINKFYYMMILKKQENNLCIYNFEIKKNLLMKLEKTLKERSVNREEELDENDEYNDKMNYICNKLSEKDSKSVDFKSEYQIKVQTPEKIEIVTKSTTINPKEAKIKEINIEKDVSKSDYYYLNKLIPKNHKSNTIFLLNNSNSKINSPSTSNRKDIYIGEIDQFSYQFSNLGTLLKNSCSLYQGYFKNGKKDGLGYKIYLQKNISIYCGEWERGQPHGHGVSLILPKQNKDSTIKIEIMKGKFRQGEFVKGNYTSIIETKDQKIQVEKYKGKFVEKAYLSGMKLKRINYKKSNSSEGKYEVEFYYFYIGDYKDKNENGKGFCIKSFPSMNYRYYYKGDFENGKMHGEGTIIFEGNSLVRRYEGIFNQDKFPSHYGKIHFSSGDAFEGFFDKENRKNHVGYYIHSDIRNQKIKHRDLLNYKETYELDLEDFDKMNDKFSITNSGDIFFGQFMCDKKHGLGKYLFNSGLLVFGNYIDGEQNGKFETVRNKHSVNESEVNFDSKTIATFSTNINSLKNNDHKLLINPDKKEKEKIYYLIENDEIIDKSYQPFQD
jgi:hypothetical protein